MKQTQVKDLAYYKTNAEEDYLQVPISVLRYISQLEQGYSEEEVLNLLQDFANEDFSNVININEWFEQFKKK